MKKLIVALSVLMLSGCPAQPPQNNSTPTSQPPPKTPDTQKATSTTAVSNNDTVSRASPVYESGPSVLTSGSVDASALRARHKKRLQKDDSPVTVLQGDSALALGQRLCEEVVPKVPKETPVMLKPNIGGFDWFKNAAKSGGDNGVSGRTTDPEFVRGVIRCLKARGLTKIIVAEGWGATHADWERLIEVGGYKKMTEEEGVPLVALDDDGVFDVEGDQPGKPLGLTGMEKTSTPTLLMPKLLAETLDHGLFISIPKIKCHRFGVVSIALKGVQGTIMYSDKSPAFRQKWRTHRELGKYLDAQKKNLPEDRALYVSSLEKFAERIYDVFIVETPDVVLAEGAPAMSGDGFQKLFPSAELVAIGGTNPVFVDKVGAQFLGLWDNEALGKELGGHKTSPLITHAAKQLGLDLSKVKVVGDGAALLNISRPAHFLGMAPFSIITGKEAPAAPAKDEKPTAFAAALGQERITLDGKGDDAAWARAKEVSWATDYAGKATSYPTRAKFLWANDGLYALFTVENTGLFTDTSLDKNLERQGLYKEDCVELFFTPDATRPKRYFEIEVGPYGHWFDIDVDREKKLSNIDWQSDAKIAATQDETGRSAMIEVKLTTKEITSLLRAGARFPMGLYRMEGKSPRSYLAWSPPKTPKPSFHVPEAFGWLELE